MVAGKIAFSEGLNLDPKNCTHVKEIERAKVADGVEARMEAPLFGEGRLATAEFKDVVLDGNGTGEDLFLAWQIGNARHGSLIASVTRGNESIFEKRFEIDPEHRLPDIVQLVDTNSDGIKDIVLHMKKNGVDAGLMVFHGHNDTETTNKPDDKVVLVVYENVLPEININVYTPNAYGTRIVINSGPRYGQEGITFEFSDSDSDGKIDFVRQMDTEPKNGRAYPDYLKIVDFYRDPVALDWLIRNGTVTHPPAVTSGNGMLVLNWTASHSEPQISFMKDDRIERLFQLGDRLITLSRSDLPDFESALGSDFENTLKRRASDYK